ncbi:hypothetical protein [Aphanothece sacrum]|uniref:Mechanosensitive ion channel protein MscS n=1 Tax=Aphanothece sacrum FPU1 TaxID=1920663 RepID=A0A401IJN8_APHSA|nr:hypothetical protein [Aphanothece sacrum]GBF81525.1 mechanosensitive ion channel protein MscS [Aphanothece sacrum FPU1]GBF86329.1 mechanosensitive ion channel protein [Aphanothece sacrum FPU3]
MRKNNDFDVVKYRSLIVGLFLTGITIILLYFVGQDEQISELDQVLVFITGITTIAALSAFANFSAIS